MKTIEINLLSKKAEKKEVQKEEKIEEEEMKEEKKEDTMKAWMKDMKTDDEMHEDKDYDDTVWHINPFRSEQDPVTRRTVPDLTTAKPTPTTIRFPVEEFLEDTISNPLVDSGLLEEDKEDSDKNA
jgi:hypothetical protein